MSIRNKIGIYIFSITEIRKNSTFNVLNRAYSVSAWIYMDGKKVPLPKNGKVYNNAKQVDFEFIVVKPPMIEHSEINEYQGCFKINT